MWQNFDNYDKIIKSLNRLSISHLTNQHAIEQAARHTAARSMHPQV